MNYFVTDLPVIVKCENPTGGRSWFFTLVGHKVFSRKNSCVHYFPHYLPTVVSKSVNKISLTDCLRKLGKNTIHPPLVSCTLKSTGPTMARGGRRTAVSPATHDRASLDCPGFFVFAQRFIFLCIFSGFCHYNKMYLDTLRYPIHSHHSPSEFILRLE